jgi:hypothetical protein
MQKYILKEGDIWVIHNRMIQLCTGKHKEETKGWGECTGKIVGRQMRLEVS